MTWDVFSADFGDFVSTLQSEAVAAGEPGSESIRMSPLLYHGSGNLTCNGSCELFLRSDCLCVSCEATCGISVTCAVLCGQGSNF